MVSGSPDVSNSCVSQSGWWCLAFRMSPIHLLPLIATHLSPCLWCPAPGCLQFICLTVWLAVSGSPDVSNSFVSRYSNSFAGGVRLSGCLQFICLPLKQFICLAVWLSISFASPYSNAFFSQSGWWCPALPMSPIHLSPRITSHLSPIVWLVVSGSPDVSNSFVSPNSKSFVSQSGWWCPALRMSPICLPL